MDNLDLIRADLAALIAAPARTVPSDMDDTPGWLAVSRRLGNLSRDLAGYMRADGTPCAFTQGGNAAHAVCMALLGDSHFQRRPGADASAHLDATALITWC